MRQNSAFKVFEVAGRTTLPLFLCVIAASNVVHGQAQSLAQDKYEAGRAAFIAEDWVRTIDELSDALRLTESKALELNALYFRGYAYAKSDQCTEAVQDLTQMISQNPAAENQKQVEVARVLIEDCEQQQMSGSSATDSDSEEAIQKSTFRWTEAPVQIDPTLTVDFAKRLCIVGSQDFRSKRLDQIGAGFPKTWDYVITKSIQVIACAPSPQTPDAIVSFNMSEIEHGSTKYIELAASVYEFRIIGSIGPVRVDFQEYQEGIEEYYRRHKKWLQNAYSKTRNQVTGTTIIEVEVTITVRKNP